MNKPDKINQLIIDTLESGKIEITNASDLVRIMEYQSKYLEDRCEHCKYKLADGAPKRTIEDALASYLGAQDGDENMFITPEENALFKEWLKTLSCDNELRKKYNMFEIKIKGDKL